MFTRSDNILRHVKRAHTFEGNELFCERCKQFFISRAALEEHKLELKCALNTNERRCYKCSKIFCSRASLRRHNLRKNCSNKRPAL